MCLCFYSTIGRISICQEQVPAAAVHRPAAHQATVHPEFTRHRAVQAATASAAVVADTAGPEAGAAPVPVPAVQEATASGHRFTVPRHPRRQMADQECRLLHLADRECRRLRRADIAGEAIGAPIMAVPLAVLSDLSLLQ